METIGKKRKRSRWWLVLGIVFLVFAVVGIAAMLSDAPARREIEALTIGNVDFGSLKDGTYTGSFSGTKGSLRDTTIEVTIKNGTVSNIRVLKGAVDETGAPLEICNGQTVYDLFDRVLERETLQVDVVSGATLTSKTHLKALENALLQAQRND